MTLISHSAPHNLLNSIQVVPRVQNVDLAHIFEIEAFRRRARNEDNAHKIPMFIRLSCSIINIIRIVLREIFVTGQNHVSRLVELLTWLCRHHRARINRRTVDSPRLKERRRHRRGSKPREPHFL